MELSSLIAAYLRTHGVNVTDGLLAKAVASAELTLKNVVPVKKTPLDYAEADWRAHAGEHDRSEGGILDDIFKMSGYSRFGVPRTGPVPDWCGMAVMRWLQLGGVDTDFDTSTLHTFNVEAFFTYGERRNVNPRRLDTEVSFDGGKTWQKIVDWHRREGKMRRWISFRDEPDVVRKYGLDLFQPVDIVNLDWKNDGKADHITMGRSWDGETLGLIEGNRTGKGPNGEAWRESVVVNDYKVKGITATCEKVLTGTSVATLYGVGRLSPLDYTQALYR